MSLASSICIPGSKGRAEWKSPGQLSQPKLGMTIQGKRKRPKTSQSLSSSTHSHSHLLPPPQGPKLQQLMPAGSGVPKAFHAENCLWPLPDLGKVMPKVALHRSAEGCTQILEQFLPGEQPVFSTAQSNPFCSPQRTSKSSGNPIYPAWVIPEQRFAKSTFVCSGILVWNPVA